MLSNFNTNTLEIKNKILDIATGLEKANSFLLLALESQELQTREELFKEAKTHIKNIRQKSDKIDNHIIKVLALFSPEARDLRELVAYLKITNELSRACSNTRNFISGFSEVREDIETNIIKEYATPMQNATLKAISHSVNMLECEDEEELQELYNFVLIEESKSEELYVLLERKLYLQAADTQNFEQFHTMLKALRKSTKIVSRTHSIAKLLLYAKIGGSFHS